MSTHLGDLNAFLDPSMTFNIGPKQYRIPPVSWELGLWGRKVAALGMAPQDKVDPAAWKEIGEPPLREGYTFEDELLSKELIAELLADRADDEQVKHLMATVYARLVGNDEFALAVFQGNVASGPVNRKERRTAAKKAAPRKASSSRTTNTAEGSTTRKAASGSTTKSLPPAKATKAASRGGKSSSAGRS